MSPTQDQNLVQILGKSRGEVSSRGVTKLGVVEGSHPVSGCDRGTPNLHGSHPFVTAGRGIL